LSCLEFSECVATNANGEPLNISCDSEHGICNNTLGSFLTCACEDGFTGKGKTCTKVPPLPVFNAAPGLADPCDNCIDKASVVCGEVEKVCICAPGYFSSSGFGGACQNIDECSDDAQNDCDANALCIELDGGFDCLCKPGFLEMVGLVQTKTSVPTRASSSVIQC
jgi:hypothetical protein